MLLYQDDPKKISQFYLKLLKALPGWRSVSLENWLEGLAKEYRKREIEVNFPTESSLVDILTIPLPLRLEILRKLCDFHLEQPEHFWETLRVRDGAASWRIEPIGQDNDHRRYWVLSDGRMYREIRAAENFSASKSRNQKTVTSCAIADEENWELVCLSRSDYEEFLTSGLSSRPKDRSFLKLIQNNVIPEVQPILSYQLSEHKRYFQPVGGKLTLLPRKRSSRLVEKEVFEQQAREAEEAERKEREKQHKLARVALLGRELTSMDSTCEDLASQAAAERENRAELRRLKREKEAQVKVIEEAFFASLQEQSEDVDDGVNEEEIDILSNSNNNLSNEPPKSPIKLVFKLSKPVEEQVEIVNQSAQEFIGDSILKVRSPKIADSVSGEPTLKCLETSSADAIEPPHEEASKDQLAVSTPEPLNAESLCPGQSEIFRDVADAGSDLGREEEEQSIAEILTLMKK